MNKKIILENYNRDYLIQGLVYVDNYLLISAYKKSFNKDNSVIYIYDLNYRFIHQTILDTSSHVGGIAYDNVHNIIWISDNGGTVSGYKKDDIFSFEKVKALDGYKKIPVADDLLNYRKKPAVSYLTFSNNKLYLGNFVIFKSSELRSYDIDKNGKIILDSKKIISSRFPRNVQGIFFKDNYVISISSYGKYLNSKLTYYRVLNDRIIKEKSKYINVRMAEQFTYVGNKLLVASELGGNYYDGNKAYDICEINNK